ncbi:MAG TPA: hypothetical protein VGY77_12720, partial [Gemmataceae bacterium]|nr:hypothetical protein [Gemmataceae bacterium]
MARKTKNKYPKSETKPKFEIRSITRLVSDFEFRASDYDYSSNTVMGECLKLINHKEISRTPGEGVTGKPDRLGFYGLLVEQVMQALRMADLVNAIVDRMMNFFQAVRPFTFLNGTGTIIITTSSLACFVVPGKQRACGSEAGGKTG